MPMFSCYLALTFALENLRMSDLTDTAAPTTEFRLRLLGKSRLYVNKNPRFNLVCMHVLTIKTLSNIKWLF